jgi:hypothetical protein
MIGTALEPIYLDVDVSPEEYELEVDNGEAFDVELDTVIKVEYITGDTYEGPYEVTPTTETQTLATQLKTATQNITINPIPSNYGLITWNGSVLTVS